jgi:CRISPR-associated protein Cas5d
MLTILLHVWGDYACFTRPEMKVERVSYDVMTPSAARGILDAIHWKPAITWVIDRIHVLKPIQFQTFRRNEVTSKVSSSKAKKVMDRNETLVDFGLAVDDERQQRSTVALYDVAYVIEAHFEMTQRDGRDDAPAKHLVMFNRRAAKGQCFHRPYFGCREFAANFELVEGEMPSSRLPPDQLNRDLGWMLYDIDFKGEDYRAKFFQCKLENGIIDVAKARAGGIAI